MARGQNRQATLASRAGFSMQCPIFLSIIAGYHPPTSAWKQLSLYKYINQDHLLPAIMNHGDVLVLVIIPFFSLLSIIKKPFVILCEPIIGGYQQSQIMTIYNYHLSSLTITAINHH